MEAFLNDLLRIVTTLFAITTMLSMGLNLSYARLFRPLREVRLVAGALIASFVVVPVVALGLAELLSLDEDIRVGLVLVSVAAGAPLTVLLADLANARVGVAVALVALLLVATIVYIPIVLPLLIDDVDVNALGVGWALVWQMLLPLGIGLAVFARWNNTADWVQPKVALVSNISLLVLLMLTLGLNLPEVFGLFGSGGVIALILLYLAALVTGYALGIPSRARRITALATGQRNLAAAFIIATASFADRPDVLAMLGAAGLLGFAIVIPTAIAFGRLYARERPEERDVTRHPRAA